MAAIWNKYSIPEIVLHSINAGNDIILFCGKADIEEQREIVKAFKDLVNQGKIPMERVNESVKKVLAVKEKYTKANNEPIIKNHLAEELVNKSITKVIDENNLLPIKEEDRVLILFPKLRIASLVDNVNQDFVTLGKNLSYDEIVYEDDEEIRKIIVQKQQKYDKIVMATYNVIEDDFQVKLANLLDKSKTLFVSLRSPFDFNFIQGIKTYICTYDSTPESLKALSIALKGKFAGVLPINLRRN
jgi:beta-N-acetylhexosaminidase